MHNTPPLPAAPSNSSVGNDAPIAPYAPLLAKTLSLRGAVRRGNPYSLRAASGHYVSVGGRRLPTVVPADSRPLSWPPIGALPRNRLASSATGGASPISPTPRLHRTPCPAPVGRGALTPPHDMHRTASQKLSLRGAQRRGNPYSPNTKNRPANPAGRSHFLRNMYSLSCPCDAATPAPDPSRTSASCSPPPARHSGGTAHSTSQR